MKFSAEQEKIINAGLNNNLISASAGSGKTTRAASFRLTACSW